MIPTNGNTQGRNRFFSWLDDIMGNRSAKVSGGLDTPLAQNMSNAVSSVAGRIGEGMSNFGVDWDFIKGLEGRKLKGYVPTDKAGNVFDQSGVTIGTGFDIGQRSIAELKSMGLPDTLVTKLAPYAGKKKTAAIQALNTAPLRLSNGEVDLLDKIVKQKELDKLVSSYNKSSKTKFENLLPEQQTILASVAFQYGDLSKKTPNFWRAVTSGNWAQAHKNLMNFGDKYKTRRNKEASLLGKIFNA